MGRASAQALRLCPGWTLDHFSILVLGGWRVLLLLDGLEVFDENEEIPADHFLADRAATDHLSNKSIPPRSPPDGEHRTRC